MMNCKSFYTRVFIAVFLVLGGAATVTAEETSPVERPPLYQSESAGSKLAYVDVMVLFNRGLKTQPVIAELQKEMERKQAGRKDLVTQYELLRGQKASEEAVELQYQSIVAYDQETEVFLNARQTELFTPVFDAIETAVKRYGQRQGYHAIYVEPHTGAEDVTEAILAVLSEK